MHFIMLVMRFYRLVIIIIIIALQTFYFILPVQ